MKKKSRLLRTVVIISLTVSSCTPVQIAYWENKYGVRFSDEERAALLAAPDHGGFVHDNPAVERWHDVAMLAGWEEADWQWLSCVISRETGRTGDPGLHNGEGADDSYGLMQLNMKAHKKWVLPLVEGDPTKLYDPLTNLSLAKFLFDQSGKGPWRANKRSCK